MLEKVWSRWFFAGGIVGLGLAMKFPGGGLEPPLALALATIAAIPSGIIGFFLDRNIPGRAPDEPILTSDANKIAYRKEYAAKMKFSHKARTLIGRNELIPAPIVERGPRLELAVGRLRISHGENRTSIYSEFVIDEWDIVFESEETPSRLGGTRRELIPKEGGGYEEREYTEWIPATEEIRVYKPGSWEAVLENLFKLSEMKASQFSLQQEHLRHQVEKSRFGL